MAVDATGTPTSPDSIPKYATSADAPSGKGFNAAMDAIQTALSARASKPSGIVSGEVPVWNGSTWVRSSVTNIGPTSLGSGTPDATKFLRGDGTWQVPASAARTFDGCWGYSSAGLVVGSSSNTAGTWDTFQKNTGGYTFFSGRVVLPKAGVYRVTCQVIWPAGATGIREILPHHYTSGGADSGFIGMDDRGASGPFNFGQSITVVESFAINEMIGVQYFQNSGGSLSIGAGAVSIGGYQQFFIEYLGA